MTRQVLGNDPFERLGRIKPKSEHGTGKIATNKAKVDRAGKKKAGKKATRRQADHATGAKNAGQTVESRQVLQPTTVRLSVKGLAARTIARFLYDLVFRVDARKAHNVPERGPVLVAANHAGVIPYDALMLQVALERRPGVSRSSVVILEPRSTAAKVQSLVSGTAHTWDQALESLSSGHACIFFPEGCKALTKSWMDRHRLLPFQGLEVFSAALDMGATVVPAAVSGPEYSHPVLTRFNLAGTTIPILATFPLLGPLGLIPLPVKWSIVFGDPITPGDLETPEGLSEAVRRRITSLLGGLLKERKLGFF